MEEWLQKLMAEIGSSKDDVLFKKYKQLENNPETLQRLKVAKSLVDYEDYDLDRAVEKKLGKDWVNKYAPKKPAVAETAVATKAPGQKQTATATMAAPATTKQPKLAPADDPFSTENQAINQILAPQQKIQVPQVAKESKFPVQRPSPAVKEEPDLTPLQYEKDQAEAEKEEKYDSYLLPYNLAIQAAKAEHGQYYTVNKNATSLPHAKGISWGDDINVDRNAYIQEQTKLRDARIAESAAVKQKAQQSLQALSGNVKNNLREVEDYFDAYTERSAEGDKIPDKYKLDQWASSKAKQYGLEDDGFYKKHLYNEAKAAVAHKIIEPKVLEKFDEKWKEASKGKTLDEETLDEYKKGFTAKAEIEQKRNSQAQMAEGQIRKEAKIEAGVFADGIKNEANEVKTAYEQAAKGLTSPEQAKALYEATNQKLVELNKKFLQGQNAIGLKYNAKYRRTVDDLTKIAQSRIDDAAKKYNYSRSPELQKKIEKIYGDAYNDVIHNEEAAKGIRDDLVFTPVTNFFRSFTSSIGGAIKGISTTLNFDSGALFGDYLTDVFQVGSAELNGIGDLLDLNKLAKSGGALAGSMLPAMAAAAGVTFATGGSGAPVGVTLLASGLASWGAETMDMTGRMRDEIFAKTGSAAAAEKAAKQTFDSQVLLMPAYALDGLPFLKASKLGWFGKGMARRAAVGGTTELFTEFLQEYPQNLFEERIRKGDPYLEAFGDISLKSAGHTLLNIAPVFLVGGGSHVATDVTEHITAERQAKAFALKNDFKNVAPSQREQYLFNIMQEKGKTFATAYVGSLYSGGVIGQAEAESLSRTLQQSETTIVAAKKYGLSPAQTKVYGAMSFQRDAAMQQAASQTDPTLKQVAEEKAKVIGDNMVKFVKEGKGDYVVLTYPNNEQYVLTHDEAENLITNPKGIEAYKNGEILLQPFGKRGVVNETLEQADKEVKAKQEAQKKFRAENDKWKERIANVDLFDMSDDEKEVEKEKLMKDHADWLKDQRKQKKTIEIEQNRKQELATNKRAVELNPALGSVETLEKQINDKYDQQLADLEPPKVEAPKVEAPKADVAPQATPETESVLQRVNNAEYINENEIKAAEDELYTHLEKNPDAAHLIEPLIEKLQNYEFTTATETRTVTEKKPTERTTKTQIKIKPALEQGTGSRVTVTNPNGTKATGVLKVENGHYVVMDGKGNKVAAIGEKAINDRDLKMPEGDESPVELDKDGNVKSITVQTKDGKLITIENPEVALDLAIQLHMETMGEIPEGAFQKVWEEESKQVQVEVPKPIVEKPAETKTEKEPESKKEKETEKEKAPAPETEKKPAKEKEPTLTAEPEGKPSTGEEWLAAPGTLTPPPSVTVAAKDIDKLMEGGKAKTKVGKFLEDAAKTIKAMSLFMRDLNVTFHNTYDSYEKGVLGEGRATKEDAKRSSGFYVNNKTNQIHIFVPKAMSEDIFHEAFHPLLTAITKDDAAKIKEMHDDVLELLDEVDGVADAVAHGLQYKKEGEAKVHEETVVQFAALVADRTIDLGKVSKPTLVKIKELFNKIAKFFKSNFQFDTSIPITNEDSIVEIAQKFTDAIHTGRQIKYAPVITDEKGFVVNPKFRAVGQGHNVAEDVTYELEADSEKMKGLKEPQKSGKDKGHVYVTEDKKLQDFADLTMLLHLPDRAFTGRILKNGKELLVGSGGIYYVVKFHELGNFWAATDKTTAEKLANLLNRVRAETGKGRMALVSASSDKVLNSAAGSIGMMKILSSKAFDKRMKLSEKQVTTAISNAIVDLKKRHYEAVEKLKPAQAAFDKVYAETKDSEKAEAAFAAIKYTGKDTDVALATKVQPDRIPNISPAIPLKKMQKIMEKYYGYTNTTFQERKFVNESIFTQVVKEIEDVGTGDEMISFFEKAADKKLPTGALKVTKLRDGFSNMLNEPMLRDTEKNKIYAILEIDGEVEAVEKHDEHQSYGWVIQSKRDKDGNPLAKTTLHILQDREDWRAHTINPKTDELVTEDERKSVLPTTAGLTLTPIKLAKNIEADKKWEGYKEPEAKKPRKTKQVEGETKFKQTDDDEYLELFNGLLDAEEQHGRFSKEYSNASVKYIDHLQKKGFTPAEIIDLMPPPMKPEPTDIDLHREMKKVEEYVRKAQVVLKKLYPNATLTVYNTADEYVKNGGKSNSRGMAAMGKDGKHIISLNLELMMDGSEGKTAVHEVLHPIVYDVYGANSTPLRQTWRELKKTMTGVKGFDAVLDHVDRYESAKEAAEGITELLTQIVIGNIDLKDVVPIKEKQIIELLNKLFELLYIDYRITSPEVFRQLAKDVSIAFHTGDVSAVQESIKGKLYDHYLNQVERVVKSVASKIKPVKIVDLWNGEKALINVHLSGRMLKAIAYTRDDVPMAAVTYRILDDGVVMPVASQLVKQFRDSGAILSIHESIRDSGIDIVDGYDSSTEQGEDIAAQAKFKRSEGFVSNKPTTLKKLGVTEKDTATSFIDKLIAHGGEFTDMLKMIKSDDNFKNIKLDPYADLEAVPGAEHGGLYHPEGGKQGGLLQIQDIGDAYYNGMHEFMHFLTLDSKVAQESKNTPAYKALNEMYEYIAAKKGRPGFLHTSSFNLGLANVNEFMAELKINEGFRDYVSEVTAENFDEIKKTASAIRASKVSSITGIIYNLFKELFDKLASKKNSGIDYDSSKPVVENAAALATKVFFPDKQKAKFKVVDNFEEREKELSSQHEQQGNRQDSRGTNGSRLEQPDSRGTSTEVRHGETSRYVVGRSNRVVQDESVVNRASIPDAEASTLKERFPDAIFDQSFSEVNSADQFHAAITASLKGNKFSSSVFVYPVEEYKSSRLFLTDDGKAGVAITKEGDIISVFSHGEGKGRVTQLLIHAVRNGGVSLDHYDTRLTDIYSKFGFVPAARVKFNKEFAPDNWDTELYKPYNNGEPDVIAMAYHGGNPNTIHERAGRFENINPLLENTPYAEDWDQAKKMQADYVKKVGSETKFSRKGGVRAADLQDELNRIRANVKGQLAGTKPTNTKKIEAVKDVIRAEVTALLKGAKDSKVFTGTVKASLLKTLIDKLNAVSSPYSMLRFVDYLDKSLDNVEYEKDLQKANAVKAKIKSAIKDVKKVKNAGAKEVIKDFLRINPDNVDDIYEYADKANKILGVAQGIKVSNVEGGVNVKNPFHEITLKEIEDYTGKELAAADKIAAARIAEIHKDLIAANQIDPSILSARELQKLIDGLLGTEEEVKAAQKQMQDDRDEKMDTLKAVAHYVLTGLDDYNNSKPGLTKEEQEIVDNYRKIDVESLNASQLARLIDAVNHIVVNESFVGAGEMSVIATVKQAIKQLSDYYTANKVRFGDLEGFLLKKVKSVASTQLVHEFITRSSKAAAKLQLLSGVFGINNGHVRSKVLQVKTVDGFDKMKKGMKNIDSAMNRYYRGVYADVMNNFGGDEAEVNEEFNRRKSWIRQTADRLLDSSVKEERVKGVIVDRVYNELLKDAKTPADVTATMKRIEPNNIKLVNYWQDAFAKRKELVQENTELYNNKIWEDVEGYTATSIVGVDNEKGIAEKAEQDIFADAYNSKSVRALPAGTKMTKTRGKYLPDNSVLDLDFDSVQSKKFYETNYDIETAKHIMQFKHFMSSPDVAALFGGKYNRNVIIKSVKQMVQLQRGKVPIYDDEGKSVEKTLNAIQAKSARIALGSVLQLAWQYISIVPSTHLNLGKDMGLFTKALFMSNDLPLFDQFGIGLRGETKAGYEKKVDTGEIDRAVLAGNAVKTYKAAMNLGQKMHDLTMKALVTSDVSVARTSWLAYYMKSLKKQGVDIRTVDWKNEHLNPNLDAAAYAEQMVSRSQNVNDPSNLGNLFRDTGSGWKKILLNLVLPFSSFSVNQRVRMTNDMQKILYSNQKGEAALSLAGTIAETLTFNAIKIYLTGLLTTVMAKGLAKMLGYGSDDDDDEVTITIAGKEIKTTKKTKKYVGTVVSDFFFSGMGTFTQTQFNERMNALYRIMATEEYADGKTNEFPNLYYSPKRGEIEWWENQGLYSVLPNKIADVYNEGKMVITGDIDHVPKGQGGINPTYEKVEMTEEEQHMYLTIFMIDAVGWIGLSDAGIRQMNTKLKLIAKKAREKEHGGDKFEITGSGEY